MSTRLTDARWRILAMMVANSSVDVDADTATATATVAEGTNAGTFQLANITKFNVNGVQYVKAATDNIAAVSWDTTNEPFVTISADGATAERTRFLVLINAAGTVTLRQSAVVAAADDLPDLPAMPTNGLYATMGSIEIVTDGTLFLLGTTDIGAAGITETFSAFTWPTTGVSHLNFLT